MPYYHGAILELLIKTGYAMTAYRKGAGVAAHNASGRWRLGHPCPARACQPKDQTNSGRVRQFSRIAPGRTPISPLA